MSNSLEISKCITLGSTSIWLNVTFLIFVTKPNIIISRDQRINILNTIFTMLQFNTGVISVLKWNPDYILARHNPYEKIDGIFTKINLFLILYYKISHRGLKTNFGQPLLIMISFMASQFYSKTQDHIKQCLFDLLFRHMRFIWTMELIDNNAFIKTIPLSIFYWVRSLSVLYKYSSVAMDTNEDGRIARNYIKECNHTYIFSVLAYLYSLKNLT